MAKSSIQTLLANLIQQASSAMLLLILPNLIDKDSYSQIVYVGVLLLFMPIADIGFSLVYGRLAPAVVANDDKRKLRDLDASVLGFGLISSIVFGLLIAVIYWEKYQNPFQALLVIPVPVMVYWASFHVSRLTVTGNFKEYRRIVSLRAATSLLAIPLVMLVSLLGWFMGQLLASFLVLMAVGRRLIEPLDRINWHLLRKYVIEGLLLSAVTVSWLQLLNFGRFYATLFYSNESIAHYGLAGAAYQSLSTLIISAFLPVSVGILSRFATGDRQVMEYIYGVIAKTSGWVLAGSLLAAELAPYVLNLVFPHYEFNGLMLRLLLLGCAYYPTLIGFGACLGGKERSGLNLTILLACHATSAFVGLMADSANMPFGAAWAQLVGIMLYCTAVLVASGHVMGVAGQDVWRRSGIRLLVTHGIVVGYLVLRGVQ